LPAAPRRPRALAWSRAAARRASPALARSWDATPAPARGARGRVATPGGGRRARPRTWLTTVHPCEPSFCESVDLPARAGGARRGRGWGRGARRGSPHGGARGACAAPAAGGRRAAGPPRPRRRPPLPPPLRPRAPAAPPRAPAGPRPRSGAHPRQAGRRAPPGTAASRPLRRWPRVRRPRRAPGRRARAGAWLASPRGRSSGDSPLERYAPSMGTRSRGRCRARASAEGAAPPDKICAGYGAAERGRRRVRKDSKQRRNDRLFQTARPGSFASADDGACGSGGASGAAGAQRLGKLQGDVDALVLYVDELAASHARSQFEDERRAGAGGARGGGGGGGGARRPSGVRPCASTTGPPATPPDPIALAVARGARGPAGRAARAAARRGRRPRQRKRAAAGVGGGARAGAGGAAVRGRRVAAAAAARARRAQPRGGCGARAAGCAAGQLRQGGGWLWERRMGPRGFKAAPARARSRPVPRAPSITPPSLPQRRARRAVAAVRGHQRPRARGRRGREQRGRAATATAMGGAAAGVKAGLGRCRSHARRLCSPQLQGQAAPSNGAASRRCPIPVAAGAPPAGDARRRRGVGGRHRRLRRGHRGCRDAPGAAAGRRWRRWQVTGATG
jgi:hypothetical protein